MKMLKVTFVCIILIFQVITAEHADYRSDEESVETDVCEEEDYDCKSKPKPNTEDIIDEGFAPNKNGDSDDLCKESKKGCKRKPPSGVLQGNCDQCGIAFESSEQGRVINGRPVRPIYKYPWIVSLIRNEKIVCGGSILSANFILTAAHCLFNEANELNPQCRGRTVPSSCFLSPRTFKVGLLMGEQRTPSETISVSRIITHPRYSHEAQIHDIALLQLARPIRCSAYNMPVCLPVRDFTPLGLHLITAGYGYNTPEGTVGPQLLREGTVKIIDTRHCARRSQPLETLKSIVCAAGTESGTASCYGDSGSSIFRSSRGRFYAVGVVAHGHYEKCSTENPVTYSKVFAYLPFIRRYIRDLPQG